MSAEEQNLESRSPLAMSDEDLLRMSPQEYLASLKKQQAEAAEQSSEAGGTEASESRSEASEAAPGPEEGEAEEEAQEGAEEPTEEEEGTGQDPYEGAEEREEGESEEPEETEEEVEETSAQKSERVEKSSDEKNRQIDYKSEYERLFAPLKAAKREVTVKSVDDARNLMQMGVDYAKKMETLRPRLRIIRTLEKNDLISEEKVNFLVDLHKKHPEAIKKFLKDSEIDPMDLNLSEETEYKPTAHVPSEKESEIDDVLDRIRETPSFQRTVDELGNKWDAPSKKILFENPQLIEIINGQIANGMYDQIMEVVESERLLGRLQGLNDLMAYKAVGDALQAQNAFKHLEAGSEPKPKQSQDPELKARKRAASPTRRSSSGKPSTPPNPLSMSDEEFEKMGKPSFV